MKTTIKTGFAALVLLLAISCKKENSNIQSIPATNTSSTEDLSVNNKLIRAIPSIRIGSQLWMAKDLRVNRYRNGDSIPQVTDPNAWAALTSGAWCWYNNDPHLGKLYNWYAVNDPRGLAPTGWHVPSDAEFTTLSTFLGGEEVAGGKMKETGTKHWLTPNTDATNSSGFTGLPGGLRRDDGFFTYTSYYSYWWTSSKSESLDSYMREGAYNSPKLNKSAYWQGYGLSVRCIKD